MDTQSELQETLITLTADIVAAHVSNNSVAVSDLPVLIANVHGALAGLGGAAPVPEVKQEPAVSVRSSIKPDYIVCLEDGKKLKMLKRHLMTHYQMTPGTVPRQVEPAGRLSDGRPQLCRAAPRWRRRSAWARSAARRRADGARSPASELPPDPSPRR